MKRIALVVALVGMLADIGTAIAQTYPSRPITMIVPFAAGGPMDVVARVVAEGMRAPLGQSVSLKISSVPEAASVLAGWRAPRRTALRSAMAAGRRT